MIAATLELDLTTPNGNVGKSTSVGRNIAGTNIQEDKVSERGNGDVDVRGRDQIRRIERLLAEERNRGASNVGETVVELYSL